MLDKMMLNGDDEPNLADNMQELRAAMDMAKKPSGRLAGTREDLDQLQQAVDLHSMLIRCADAVADNDRRRAADLLQRIRHHSSPSGNATQRLAHCFAEGLQVRLNGTGNLHYRSSSLMPKSASSSSGVQLKAMQFFMATCCFLPVNILFSNKSIYKAAAGRKKLHIVHYGLDHGLWWATLLRWLARREGGPPEVRLTGIDVPQPGFRPARLIEEVGFTLGGHVCRGLEEQRRGEVAGGEEGAGYGERVGHHLLPHPRVRRQRTLGGPSSSSAVRRSHGGGRWPTSMRPHAMDWE